MKRIKQIGLLSVLVAGMAGCSGSSSSPLPLVGTFRPDRAQSRPERIENPAVATEWTYNNKKGRCIRTANYAIYTTEESPAIVGRLPGFVEAALRNYTTALGDLPPPSGTLETFVMSSRTEWERLTKQIMGADAELYLRIPRGGYAASGRGVYYDIGAADTLSIAGHEGWHQYTQRVFRQPLPTWLEEGVATYMEGHRWEGATPRFLAWSNLERFDQLRSAAAAGTLMPLEQLISTSPQDLLGASPDQIPMKRMSTQGGPSASDRLLTYYAQLWALVHFLNEGEHGKYSSSLRRLLADAASGALRDKLAGSFGEQAAKGSIMMRRGPAAIVAYFNQDVDQFGGEYRAFIEKVVAVRSRDRIVSGLSPVR
ncbi:MAG: hypothetical protein AB7G11_17225 [Phycisphaerales bacterium]